MHKFHFDFFRLCGLQFCECASFTAVRKFHRRVAHLSSLRACFVITVKKYQIYVQKCSFSLKNPIAVVKNSLNQVLLCVSFANFCASSWEKANGSLWPPPHLNGLLNYALVVANTNFHFLKPMLIPRQGDLFLYGTEALICPINRKGSWVGCLGWQRGRARTFFLSIFLRSFFR